VDTDGDGLSNGAEVAVWRTQPLDTDTFDGGTEYDWDIRALRMDYRLPWSLLGSPARLNLGLRVRPVDEDLTLDQLDVPGYWLTLSREAFPVVRNGVDFRHRVHLPLVLRSFR